VASLDKVPPVTTGAGKGVIELEAEDAVDEPLALTATI
jgi:hypothetical protein